MLGVVGCRFGGWCVSEVGDFDRYEGLVRFCGRPEAMVQSVLEIVFLSERLREEFGVCTALILLDLITTELYYILRVSEK